MIEKISMARFQKLNMVDLEAKRAGKNSRVIAQISRQNNIDSSDESWRCKGIGGGGNQH